MLKQISPPNISRKLYFKSQYSTLYMQWTYFILTCFGEAVVRVFKKFRMKPTYLNICAQRGQDSSGVRSSGHFTSETKSWKDQQKKKITTIVLPTVACRMWLRPDVYILCKTMQNHLFSHCSVLSWLRSVRIPKIISICQGRRKCHKIKIKII